MPSIDIEPGQPRAALIKKLLSDAEGHDHQDVLSALMTVYVALAAGHECCTRDAALLCVKAASSLQKAATLQRLAGAPLH